jgi:plasmid stabilization system protein ParE
MKITWAPRAKRRAGEYGEHIAQDNEEAAYAWLVGIFEEVERLKDFPEQGRVVPELGRPDVREIFYMSHRIIYKVGSRRIRIVTIRHGRQLLDKKKIK